MALSAAERKRKQRERQAAERGAKVDPSREYAKAPFFEYAQENSSAWSNVELMFDMMGIEPPEFVDDRGPSPYDPDAHIGLVDVYRGRVGSLGRAEVMIEHMIDAATELASMVNDYKREAIEARIAELQRADLASPEQRRTAVTELLELEQIRGRLGKAVRRTFPEWSGRGERD